MHVELIFRSCENCYFFLFLYRHPNVFMIMKDFKIHVDKLLIENVKRTVNE